MAKRGTLMQRWANVSLRSKITGVTVLILLFGLAVAGFGTTSVLRPTLYGNQDRDLLSIQADPTSALQPGATAGAFTRADVIYAPTNNYVALFDSAGNFLYDNSYKQAEQGARGLQIARLQVDEIASNPPNTIFNVRARDGSDWRAVISPIRDSSSGAITAYLVFASSTRVIDAVIVSYLTIFTGFGIAVILLGAALTRVLVTTTLEPLSEVERTAREIARGDFSKRIHVITPNTELGHVGASLNVMLDQIDKSFKDRATIIDNMRRFVGDAGHELRTPLASVRGYAEMYRMGILKEDEAVKQAMDRIEKEAIRMTSLVEDLLSLARLDSSRALDLVPLDLNALAQDAVLDAGAQDPAREFKAIISPDSPMALGDEHKVRQVMTNLLGNAIRHTEPQSDIELVVISLPHCARFEIRDHGEGVPEQIRDKIFERFWRADTSRNRETGGSGLGLAIVASIVKAHNGRVSCVETPGGGATFRVDLPAVESKETAQHSAAKVFELEDKAKVDSPRARRKAERKARKATAQEEKLQQKQQCKQL
ncbi:HAMP domain-containing histidine kinase [Canibacter sp. lx-72]|uniref:sensor histidine kinase n=1 Tax=Canibacter zhuwentaonis TaxID=2837491 RepID=UPI001BDC0A9F|nr:HAMP domain-containing sensor histidine kinase [Canibacter zhuwentaonis]MBT1018614.1 HAMP domain-containing histidine kinase [Canibacter zhuwentaonis]